MGLSKKKKWKHLHVPIELGEYLELNKKKEKLGVTWKEAIEKGIEALEKEMERMKSSLL